MARGCPVTVQSLSCVAGAWIFGLSNTNSVVATAAQVAQQSTHSRGLTGFMTVVRLEPEAVENGPMNGETVVVHSAMRGAVVEVEEGVGRGVFGGTR